MLTLCGAIATALTGIMFFTRSSLLGFPSGIMWFITGAVSYQVSAATWDVYYILFFACMFFGVWAIYAAFGLREKHDTIADEGIEKGDGAYVDDDKTEPDTGETKPSVRTRQLRDRAKKRRTGESRQEKVNWGEFK